MGMLDNVNCPSCGDAVDFLQKPMSIFWGIVYTESCQKMEKTEIDLHESEETECRLQM